MKKWLTGLVIATFSIVILAAVFLPFAMGLATQERYPAILASLSRPGKIQVNLLSYQRGWFQSNAVVEVKILQPTILKITNVGNDSLSFKITQKIEHGPWFWVAPNEGASQFLIGLALMRSEMDPSFGAVKVLSLLKRDGGLTSVIQAKKLQVEDATNNLHFQATNIGTIFRVSPDLQRITGEAYIQQAAIQSADLIQNFEGLAGDYQLQKTPSGLWIGNKKTQIRTLTLMTPDRKTQVNLLGLSVALKSTEQNAKMDFVLDVNLDKLVYNQVAYGPQQVSLNLRQLDIPTLTLLQRALGDMSADGNISGVELMRYNQILMQLLSKGLQLEINKLAVQTAWGAASASAQVILQPLSGAVTPQALLDALNATIHLNFPATALVEALQEMQQASAGALAIMGGSASVTLSAAGMGVSPEQQAQQQITQWIQNKWIVPQGNGFQVDFSYKNGQGFINGLGIGAAAITPAAQPALPMTQP